MLSPSAEETVHVQNRVERAKRGVEEQESRNFELLSLLTEMGEEMKRRSEQLKEDLR